MKLEDVRENASVNRYLPVGVVSELDAYQDAYGVPWFNRDAAFELMWQVQVVGEHGWGVDDGLDGYGGSLHSKVLERIRYDYRQYFRLLGSLGLVRVDHSYSVGRRSKCYRFHRRFRDDGPYWFRISDRCVLNALHKSQAVRRSFLSEESPNREAMLAQVQIDLNSAEARIAKTRLTEMQKASTLRACEEIANGHMTLVKDRNGREYSAITRLPRLIRHKDLRISGEPTTEVDIPCSHPRFLGKWLRLNGAPDQEVARYRDAIDRDFYDWFANQWLLHYGQPMTRKDAKGVVFRVFYDRPRQNDRCHQLFRKIFPKSYELLRQHKYKHGYARIANELMQVEARFVFGFCDKLTEPFYTVHDSIGVRESISEQIEEEFFAALGVFLEDDEWL